MEGEETHLEDARKESKKDRDTEKKKNFLSKWWVPVLVVCFVIGFVIFWSSGKAEASKASHIVEDEPIADESTETSQAEEYQSFVQNLLSQKQLITEKLKQNYEQAVQNRKLFQSMNADAEEENIQTSFILKDDRDSSKSKLMQENSQLLVEKNNLIRELQQVDSYLSQT
jgi:cbb3-type cytochrome oxidase subunit 3